MADWRFYGRSLELRQLDEIMAHGRWFFVKITGRRRIGKSALVKNVLTAHPERKVFYVQIPDSEDAGVLSAFINALDAFQVPPDRFPRPRNMAGLANSIEAMARAGYVVVLDEFQYFNRKAFVEFCSYLQASVDRLQDDSNAVAGGMAVLGSIHTEMSALLEERSAPLYNRVTDSIELTHLDIGAIGSILRDHSAPLPSGFSFSGRCSRGCRSSTSIVSSKGCSRPIAKT